MVLKWTNRGSAPKVAPKPAAAVPAAAPSTFSPSPAVAYDGAPIKPASELFKSYGKHVFTGKLAEYYLKKNGGTVAMMEDPSWVSDRPKADIMAAAVLNW